MRQMFPDFVSEPNTREYLVRLTGAGAATPTKVFGNNITLSRTGVGVYRMTFSENPFKPIGIAGYHFESTTGTDVKGFTLTSTTFDATNLRQDIFIWNSAFAAADLSSVQTLVLRVIFKEGGV